MYCISIDGGDEISNRSYLHTPKGSFETSNCLGLGWFLLFQEKDGRINLDLSENDNEEMEDEVCEFVTTVQKALENLGHRISLIKDPYIQEFFKGIEPLRELLEENPSDGEVRMNCYEFAMMGDDNLIGLLKVLPEELEEILSKNDIEQLGSLFAFIGPNIELTFDIEAERRTTRDRGMTLSEALIGFRE